jgi:hypothetical protein
LESAGFNYEAAMIDLTGESILSLKEAAKILPSFRSGRPVSFACVWRWVQKGCRATNGRKVKLEALRLGSRWITSREALQRFAEQLTAESAEESSIDKRSTRPTFAQRRRAAERA